MFLSQDGRLLGESLHDQRSSRFGGVVPSLAMSLHGDKIQSVVTEAMERSGLDYSDLEAIAVANRPGLKGSLMYADIQFRMIDHISCCTIV